MERLASLCLKFNCEIEVLPPNKYKDDDYDDDKNDITTQVEVASHSLNIQDLWADVQSVLFLEHILTLSDLSDDQTIFQDSCLLVALIQAWNQVLYHSHFKCLNWHTVDGCTEEEILSWWQIAWSKFSLLDCQQVFPTTHRSADNNRYQITHASALVKMIGLGSEIATFIDHIHPTYVGHQSDCRYWEDYIQNDEWIKSRTISTSQEGGTSSSNNSSSKLDADDYIASLQMDCDFCPIVARAIIDHIPLLILFQQTPFEWGQLYLYLSCYHNSLLKYHAGWSLFPPHQQQAITTRLLTPRISPDGDYLYIGLSQMQFEAQVRSGRGLNTQELLRRDFIWPRHPGVVLYESFELARSWALALSRPGVVLVVSRRRLMEMYNFNHHYYEGGHLLGGGLNDEEWADRVARCNDSPLCTGRKKRRIVQNKKVGWFGELCANRMNVRWQGAQPRKSDELIADDDDKEWKSQATGGRCGQQQWAIPQKLSLTKLNRLLVYIINIGDD